MNDSHVDHAASVPSHDVLVASTLNSLEARLKHLERTEEKSFFGRIQKKASFFALMVGIVLSTISLFDVFWNKPREALFRDLEEFNKSVNAVADLRQKMIRVQAESTDQSMLLAMNSMVMPQVLAYIQYATALLPRLGSHAGIPQLIVLTSEAMNIYDWKSAGILVDRAVAAEDAVPYLRSEARRYKGKLMFSTGKPAEGRKAFQDALDVLHSESAFGINGNRAYIVADWALIEFAVGDCAIANAQIRQFIKFMQHPQILPSARAQLITTLKAQLGQQSGGARCPISPELAALA